MILRIRWAKRDVSVKKMYFLVSVVIIAMVSGILFITEAVWTAHSTTRDRVIMLEDITIAAQDVHVILGDETRTFEQINAITSRNLYFHLDKTLHDFNATFDNPDWITRKYLQTNGATAEIRKFQSKTLQISQFISLITTADSAIYIKSPRRKLVATLEQDFFTNIHDMLRNDGNQIEKMRSYIATFNLAIVPFTTLVLLAIWYGMIGPMIDRQYRNYKKLTASRENAVEMAELAVKAGADKARFLSVISHEMRTPLNGVIGLSETLVEQSPSKSCRGTAQEVLFKGQDLAILVDELIAVTETPTNDDFDEDAFMKTVTAKQKKNKTTHRADGKFKIPPDYRVLIADDNRTNRLVMSKLVKRMGTTAVIAKDGQQAIDAFKTDTYDLLLLDIAMPNKTGEQAIQEIRAYEKTQNRTPSVALAVTANTLQEQVASYYNSGFNDCLAKPINFARLSEKLDSMLNT
jgi:CheY-like chemotaxis protein